MAWTQLQKTLEAFYDSYAQEFYKGYEPDELIEKKQEFVKREKIFWESIISEVERMENENLEKDALVLFDIDETLARIKFSPDGTKIEGEIIRPSASFLFETIKRSNPRIHLGILTTRSRDSVIEQLGDERHLKSLAAFLENEYIYSTKQYFPYPSEKSNGPLSEEAIVAYLKKHCLVKADSISPDFTDRWVTGDYQKLEILKDIKDNNPKMPIMAVDDFSYPRYMRYVVCVYPDALF